MMFVIKTKWIYWFVHTYTTTSLALQSYPSMGDFCMPELMSRSLASASVATLKVPSSQPTNRNWKSARSHISTISTAQS